MIYPDIGVHILSILWHHIIVQRSDV